MFDEVTDPALLDPANASRYRPERFYCGCCIDTSPASSPGGWFSEKGVRQHMAWEHGLDENFLREGRDFFNGDQLRTKLLELQRENESAAERFARSLESLLGADDFAFEAES